MLREVLCLENLRYEEGERRIFGRLTLYEGEIAAILGLHDSGCEDIISCLAGTHKDFGAICHIGGKHIKIQSQSDSEKNGIRLIDLDMPFVESFSVAEFLLLSEKDTHRAILNKDRMEADAARQLEGLGVYLSGNMLVGELSPAERKILLLAKALRSEGLIYILKGLIYPAAQIENHQLFKILRHQTSLGKTFLLAGNSASEPTEFIDRLIVVRNGIIMRPIPNGQIYKDTTARLLLGRDISALKKAQRVEDVELLRVEGAECILGEVLRVNKGEVVSILASRHESAEALLEALCGRSIHTDAPWRFFIEGKPVSGTNALNAGIAYIPEEMQVNGLCENLSLGDNLLLSVLTQGRYRSWHCSPSIKRHLEKLFWEEMSGLRNHQILPSRIADMDAYIRCGVALMKTELLRPRLIILFHPFIRADEESRELITLFVNRWKRRGIAILILTSGTLDAYDLSDRVIDI